MKNGAWIKFKAKCHLISKEDYSRGNPIGPQSQPNLFLDDMHFICTIVECDHQISLGEIGEILVSALCSLENKEKFSSGKRFELRDGPNIPLAYCEITSEINVDSIVNRD